VLLAMRRHTHGEPDATAFHGMSEEAGSIRAPGPPGRNPIAWTPTRAAQTAAHAISPAPIPLGGLPRLILGLAGAGSPRTGGLEDLRIPSLAGLDGVNLWCSDQTCVMGYGFRQFLKRSIA
jgi:hypothetical protein